VLSIAITSGRVILLENDADRRALGITRFRFLFDYIDKITMRSWSAYPRAAARLCVIAVIVDVVIICGGTVKLIVPAVRSSANISPRCGNYRRYTRSVRVIVVIAPEKEVRRFVI